MPTNKARLGTGRFPHWYGMAKGWTIALVSGLLGAILAVGVARFFLGQEPPTPSNQQQVSPPAPAPTLNPHGGQGRGVPGIAVANDREQAAIALIQNLYQALSAKDWTAATATYTPAMQAQFDPAFFAQFTQVTVYDLRLVSQTLDRLELVGRNTYFYPNGDTQEEERSYTVVWLDGRPRISDSQFLRVTKPRHTGR